MYPFSDYVHEENAIKGGLKNSNEWRVSASEHSRKTPSVTKVSPISARLGTIAGQGAMMSLLREIQSAATNGDVRLADLLRKCKILAARLQHKELADWVDHELNGYQDRDPPPYRIVKGIESKGHFVANFGQQMRNAPIPTNVLPDSIRDSLETMYFSEGVSALESLIEEGKSGLQAPWPANNVALLADKFYQGYRCLEAWRTISPTVVVGILDNVRNKILTFALEIETENPEAGEAKAGEAPITQERISQVFHTVITGGTNTIAALAPGATLNLQVNQGDREGLRKFMLASGVSRDDVDALDEAIDLDPPPAAGNKKTLGSRVVTWLGTMAAKAATGAVSIGTEAMAKAILSHYGL